METFSALLAICARNSPVPGEFPAQRPVTRSFDVYFDLRPNKWLSKQSWGWWFETLACSLWRHRNEVRIVVLYFVLVMLPFNLCDVLRFNFQGLNSLSGQMSYRKISWSLKAARFGFRCFQSHWNLIGTPATKLPKCLSNYNTIWSV